MSISKKFLLLIALLISSTLVSFSQSGNSIVEFKTVVKANNSGLTEEISYLIEVDNKESDWITDIEIPYSKGEKLDILEASIINANGKVVRSLKKKEIVTRSAISQGTFFEDSYVKEFKLKWNEYPYRIKYRYRKTVKEFLYVTYWIPVVHQEAPVISATLQVELPRQYKVNIDYSPSLKYTSDTLTNMHTHKWATSILNPIKKESYSPPFLEIFPSVRIVPEEFNYGIKGSFKTWEDYGNWQSQINDNLDILTEDEKTNVDRLIDGVSDQKEIIKTLYHYMQDNTRYINVAIDMGGLQPYPASYVCEKKYGDCKALTMYMKALLKHAGIEAYYTKIYAGDNPKRLNRNLPAQQFNHVILAIPMEKDTVWLENTSNSLPYNYLGTFTQNRYGLMVNGDNSCLIKTNALETEEVKEVNSYHFKLDENGYGEMSLSAVYRGKLFEDIKYIQKSYKLSDQKRWIEKELIPKDTEIVAWEFDAVDRDQKTINLKLTSEVKNQIRKLGGSKILQPPNFKFHPLKHPDTRRTPLRINYPINRIDTMSYYLSMQDSYNVELPEDFKLSSDYGTYEETYSTIDNTIYITRHFQLYSGEYTLEEYPDFYLFFKKIKEHLKKNAIAINPA